MSPRRVAITIGVTLTTIFPGAVPALAKLCHPDPPGTRTLVVHGDVAGYIFRGSTVHLSFANAAGCARVIRWDAFAGPKSRSTPRVGSGCAKGAPSLGAAVRVASRPALTVTAFDGPRRARVGHRTISVYTHGRLEAQFARHAAGRASKAVLRGSTLLVLVSGTRDPDQPDRLEIYDVSSGRWLHTWPLPDAASTLDAAGGIALFSTTARHGLFMLRLSDGTTTLLSPNRKGDVPQIEPTGVAFESSMLDRDRRAGRVVMKFVPMRAAWLEFAKRYTSIETMGPITDLAMDGSSVAVAFREQAHCDQVLIWNALWHDDEAKPTMEPGPGCVRLGAGDHTSVGALALGGINARWTAAGHQWTRIVAASSKDCVQHLVDTVSTGSGDHVGNVAADHAFFTYVIEHDSGSATVHLFDPNAVPRQAHVDTEYVPRALSVDQERVALLRPDGQVDVYGTDGALVGSVATHGGRSIALRGNTLVVLADATRVESYDLASGAQTRMWRVPAVSGARLGVHYGIVVFSAGRSVYALRLSSGRLAVLARTPAAAMAAIDDAGAAYAYSAGSHGVMRFLPLSDVQRALDMT